MLVLRPTAPMKAVAAAISMLLLVVVGPSCGPAEPEHDKAALYTPETLASELAIRFHQLNPDTKAAKVRYRHPRRSAKDLADSRARAESTKNKTSGGPPARKKQAGPPTLDDLLADIDGKLNRIPDVSRADSCKKMRDAIAKDSSIPDAERKRLDELVTGLEESP